MSTTAPRPARPIFTGREDRVLAGILSLCFGLMFFSFQDATFKFLSGEYSVLQLLTFRSITSAPLLAAFIYWRMGINGFRTDHSWLHAGRCTLLLLAFLSFYSALAVLPLADVVALFGAAPLFITALAGPVLGEKVGVRRASAIGVGFAGVLTMLRPGSALFDPTAVLGLLAALAYSGSALLTRKLGRLEATTRLALYSNMSFLVGCGGGLMVVTALAGMPADGELVSPLLHPYVHPPPIDLALMLGTGVTSLGGVVLVARAYQIAPVSTVTPFEYSYLLWAIPIGYIGFGEIPATTTLIGAGLVVAAGIYIARREAMLSRTG